MPTTACWRPWRHRATASGWPSSGTRRPAPICCCPASRGVRGAHAGRPRPRPGRRDAQMNFEALRDAAQAAVSPAAWAYYQGVAGGPVELDAQAWASMFVVPRVLRGLTDLDTSTTIGGIEVATPVLVARDRRPPDGASGRRAGHRRGGGGRGRAAGLLQLRGGTGDRVRGRRDRAVVGPGVRDARPRRHRRLRRPLRRGRGQGAGPHRRLPGRDGEPGVPHQHQRARRRHARQLPAVELAGDVGRHRSVADPGRHR